MTQHNLLELAKQGDAKAIADLLNQSLQPKSITAKAFRNDDCLKVVLESVEIPEQQVLVAFILTEMICLGIKFISKVKVYGRQVRTFDAAWYQEFELEKQIESPSSASAQSTSANTQASFQVGFSKKRVSEAEFRAALEQCSKTARKAYERTVEYAKQAENILQQLNNNLSETTSQLLNNKNAERFEFARVLRDIVIEVKYFSEDGIKDLFSSLEIKKKHLENFTIALFGRTKAGKSTIREALQKLRQARAEMRQNFRNVAFEIKNEYEANIENTIAFYDEELWDIELKQNDLSNTEQSKVDIVKQINNKLQEIKQEISLLTK